MSTVDSATPDDGLLVTKLYISPTRAGTVARDRLLARLHAGLRCRLTLVCAPAGFGKTTLLSEWCASLQEGVPDSCTAAWLSLDREDNDPVRFWRYVLAALKIGADATPNSFSPLGPATRGMLTMLINEVSQRRRDVVLVLDDYHFIHEQAIHDDVLFLLDHLPANMHLVIASREEPPLPLARLRTQQQALELRTDDLRFDLAESSQFLRAGSGIDLSDRDIAALEELTEGWITGLQLALLSMRGRQDLSGFIQTFTGRHRYIFDYLAEEVLVRLSEEVQQFLLATSILSSMCAPLCDALTGRAEGQTLLTQLEQANVFMVPLDDTRCWYRYHHLFADMLCQRLREAQPVLIPKLHRRASLWYEHNNKKNEAIEHALDCDDFERAAGLLLSIAEELLRRGEVALLKRWIERLPAPMVCSNPMLSMTSFWTLISSGRWEEAEQRLSDVEPALPYAGAQVAIKIGHAFLAYNRGELDRSIELSLQALTATPPDDYGQRPYMLAHLAESYWLKGDFARAKQAAMESYKASQLGSYNYFIVNAMLDLAAIQTMQGHLSQAYTSYQQVLQLIEEYKGNTVLYTNMVHLGLGLILYEKNDLDEALAHLLESIRFSHDLGDTHKLLYSAILLARVRLALGDKEGAREAMLQSKRRPGAFAVFFPLASFIEYGTSVYMALGDSGRARDVMTEQPTGNPPPIWREEQQRVRTRLLLNDNQIEAALAMLPPLLESAETQEYLWGMIKILLLQARAFQAQGRRTQALSLLARALVLAEPEGFVRTFVDEGPPLKTLVLMARDAVQKGSLDAAYPVSATYVQQILVAFTSDEQTQEGQAGSGSDIYVLADPLSERELEILRLIATGKSNQEIAEELVIAMSTLKTHINRMYSKLAVRSRTQAIAQARKLLLL